MRFLTSEWASGGLTDAEWEDRWSAYQEHQRAMLPLLSAGADGLLRDVNLHDAVPKECEIGEPTIVLRFVAGDLQRGYEFVEITYSDARVSGAVVGQVRDWLADPSTEVVHGEVDLDRDRFVHRYLLHPWHEFDVHFSSVTLRRSAAQPSDR